MVEPPPRLVELRVWIEPPNANAGRTEDDAEMLVEAMASEAGACEGQVRAAAIAVRLSNELEPVKIMVWSKLLGKKIGAKARRGKRDQKYM